MARHKRAKRKHNTKEQHKYHLQSALPKPKRNIWKIFLQAVALISALTGAVVFFSRLELVDVGLTNPSEPLGTIFNLKNEGYFEIRDITVVCGIDSLRAGNAAIENLGFMTPQSHAGILSPNHEMSLPCDQILRTGPTTIARLTIEVSYRPVFAWWHRHVNFPLEATQSSSGTWFWKRIPE